MARFPCSLSILFDFTYSPILCMLSFAFQNFLFSEKILKFFANVEGSEKAETFNGLSIEMSEHQGDEQTLSD